MMMCKKCKQKTLHFALHTHTHKKKRKQKKGVWKNGPHFLPLFHLHVHSPKMAMRREMMMCLWWEECVCDG